MTQMGKKRIKRDLHYFELKQQVEEFLYDEADLLDQRQFTEWLDILSQDLVYFMPIRRNVKAGTHAERGLKTTNGHFQNAWIKSLQKSTGRKNHCLGFAIWLVMYN